KKTVFNLALPLKGQKIKKRLRRPGMLSVKCDAGHTWMSAYVYVSKHPYYSVTDKKGSFEIKDVPPGTYMLKAWHEAFGTMKKKVTVSAKGEVKVGFSFAGK
ncbi:MAG: carboxypeptidase regulatory-like domain-containing protein, partial [Desulfatiglandales bacterium]